MIIDNHREHIQRIRDDFQASPRVKDSLNNSIHALARDLYSKDTHFIFELIQNAEDNTYAAVEPSLSFRLVRTDPTGTQGSDGALIVQNNEIGFSAENVDAICAVGKTTKRKSQGYIGEKGIGFKSVFRVTSNPHVFSRGYSFCMPERDKETGLGYIVPQWVEEVSKEIDPSKTVIVLPLDKTDFGYGKIEEMLRDIEPETILFLSKIKELRIETDTGDALTILKDDSSVPHVQILVEGTRRGESFSKVDEFLFYAKSFDKPPDVSHEKRDGIDARDAAIAFPLNEDKKSAGKIFAYLPVRSDTRLPFLINADFILPSSREDILDIPWNRWLMSCVAHLAAYALPCLKEKGLLTVALLETLASRMKGLSENSIFHPIADAVRDALLNQELLPADDGTFVSARSAKLARGAELRKLLSQDQLCSLFQPNDDIKWLAGEITQDRTRDLRSYLIDELSVEEIDPDSFARKVTDSFLERQSDDWMILFYRFLRDRVELWIWNTVPLRKKSFIRLRDGAHVQPFRDDGSPNVYLPLDWDIGTELPIVKPEIAQDKEAREFLNELGIPELDVVAEVIEKVLPQYQADSPNVSADQHARDMDRIRLAYSTDSQEKKGRLREKLKETTFIFADTLALHQNMYIKPRELYVANDDLRMYFEGNADIWFVNSQYDDSTMEMLKELGVVDAVRVKRRQAYLDGHVCLVDQHSWHKRGLNGFDPDIKVIGLEFALTHPTVERSAFIWNSLVIPNSSCIRGIVESSSRQTYENSEKDEQASEFGRLLMDTAWLPHVDGGFHKPRDLSLDDLPAFFRHDEKLSDQLCMKKDVVAKLAEQAGVQVEDIEWLKQYPEEFQEWKAAIAAKKKKPAFPSRTVANPERRQEQISEQLGDAPDKEYEERERSVRTSGGAIDRTLWLRNQYTNDAGQVVCQICKKEMPFKKRNGDYYFEAVEALSKDHFPREREAQFLALCPLCAAMYKEFVRYDESAMEALKSALMSSYEPEVPLCLGELETRIRFVESHFQDIKTILEEEMRRRNEIT